MTCGAGWYVSIGGGGGRREGVPGLDDPGVEGGFGGARSGGVHDLLLIEFDRDGRREPDRGDASELDRETIGLLAAAMRGGVGEGAACGGGGGGEEKKAVPTTFSSGDRGPLRTTRTDDRRLRLLSGVRAEAASIIIRNDPAGDSGREMTLNPRSTTLGSLSSVDPRFGLLVPAVPPSIDALGVGAELPSIPGPRLARSFACASPPSTASFHHARAVFAGLVPPLSTGSSASGGGPSTMVSLEGEHDRPLWLFG